MVPGAIGLIVGGLLGSGITALATSDNGGRPVPVSRFGPGREFGPGFGFRGGPGFPGNPGFPGKGFGNNGPRDVPSPTPQPSTSS